MDQRERQHQGGRPELVRARVRHGLTQEQAAELIGVSTTTWARWERGEQRVRPVYRARLAQAWQVEAAQVERWLEAVSPAGEIGGEDHIDEVDLAACGADGVDQLWRWEMDASRRHLLAALPFAPGLLGEWLLAWRYDALARSAVGEAAAVAAGGAGWAGPMFNACKRRIGPSSRWTTSSAPASSVRPSPTS